MEMTRHLTEDNQFRFNFIKDNIGFGKIIDEFFWNKFHKDGAEIHFVTDTGIVIIVNAITGRIVTFLIARPKQIERYYDKLYVDAPKKVLNIAMEHQLNGWNLI